MITEEQYKKVSKLIEQIHLADLNHEGENTPAELLYCERMLSVLEMVYPGAPFSLKIAAQCQHLQRWGIPRSNYPFDRKGYHLWRRAVMEFQLDLTKKLLTESEIEESEMVIILGSLKNQDNKSNLNATIIMDTACLIFLKWYLIPFSAKHESSKVIDILRKTMKKMSERGLSVISKLELPEPVMDLINKAA